MNLFNKLINTVVIVWVLLIIFTGSAFADPVGSWSSSATALPYLLASHGSFSYGDNITIIGGSAATGQSKLDVITATPSAGGDVAGWTATSLAPTALIFHSLAQKDNHVYILGGREENPGSELNHVPKVFVGNLNSSGIVDSWTQLNSLPQGTSLGKGVVVENRIYYAGGFNNSGAHSEVYVADINPDGTLGTWATAGTLSEPLYGFGMVEHNNNLIVFGGYNGSAYRNKVYKASINPNGTISGFTETAALPENVYRGSSIKIGSTLISATGHNGTNYISKVYYTQINPDGTVSTWQQSANILPQGTTGSAIAYVNGYLYLSGGFNGAYLDNVYYASFNASSEVDLDVPLLKQNDLPWGGEDYDSANLWSPSAPNISS